MRTPILTFVLFTALFSAPAAANEDGVYESLGNIPIGRVFLTAQERAALDRMRGRAPIQPRNDRGMAASHKADSAISIRKNRYRLTFTSFHQGAALSLAICRINIAVCKTDRNLAGSTGLARNWKIFACMGRKIVLRLRGDS